MPISHIKAYHTMLLLIIQEKIKEPVIKEQIARLRPVHEAYRNVMDLIRLRLGINRLLETSKICQLEYM